mmetsp:Transcript_28073/g.70492  ORF Transcript_28073/g.70492 Transcript_28073/m.70492 type:complete len:412 (+) Transcript_28073:32-1267(+)
MSGPPLSHPTVSRPASVKRRPSRTFMQRRKEAAAEERAATRMALDDETIPAARAESSRGEHTNTSSDTNEQAPSTRRRPPPGAVGVMPMFDPSAVKLRSVKKSADSTAARSTSLPAFDPSAVRLRPVAERAKHTANGVETPSTQNAEHSDGILSTSASTSTSASASRTAVPSTPTPLRSHRDQSSDTSLASQAPVLLWRIYQLLEEQKQTNAAPLTLRAILATVAREQNLASASVEMVYRRASSRSAFKRYFQDAGIEYNGAIKRVYAGLYRGDAAESSATVQSPNSRSPANPPSGAPPSAANTQTPSSKNVQTPSYSASAAAAAATSASVNASAKPSSSAPPAQSTSAPSVQAPSQKDKGKANVLPSSDVAVSPLSSSSGIPTVALFGGVLLGVALGGGLCYWLLTKRQA